MLQGSTEKIDNPYGSRPPEQKIQNQQGNAENGLQAVENLQKRKIQHNHAQKKEYKPNLTLVRSGFQHSIFFLPLWMVDNGL